MKNALSLLPVIPVRKEPNHRSEMTSQLLFGEFVEVKQQEDEFSLVTMLADGYEGWIQTKQLTPVAGTLGTENFLGAWMAGVKVNDRLVQVPMGTPVYEATAFFELTGLPISYDVVGEDVITVTQREFDETALEAVYEKFLGTPYMWGGRSVFGIDCSGFAQMVYRLFNKQILRDAYLQAEEGQAVNSIEEAKAGDLAFFHSEKGRVTHVGIVIGGQKIVHASGQVRIDYLDAKGITNSDDGSRTHDLHSIRRFF